MTATTKSPLAAVIKEDWFQSLKAEYGLRCAGQFARALQIEREAGYTTPEAEAALELAIDYSLA